MAYFENGQPPGTHKTSMMPWSIQISLVRIYWKPLTTVTRTKPTILHYPAIISPIQTQHTGFDAQVVD